MIERIRLSACLLALALGGCSSGIAVNDDIQMRPTSAMLETAPVKVAQDADTCHVRRAAITSTYLPASMRQS